MNMSLFLSNYNSNQFEYSKKRKATDEERKQIEKVFYECDEGHKGYLSEEDVNVAVVSLFGYEPSEYETEKMLKTQNYDALGISLEEFIPLMLEKFSAVDEDEHIRQIFLSMDLQCQGFLCLRDFQHCVNQVAPNLPLHAIQSAFREIDRDGDGRVSYKDFEFMMKYNTDNKF